MTGSFVVLSLSSAVVEVEVEEVEVEAAGAAEVDNEAAKSAYTLRAREELATRRWQLT